MTDARHEHDTEETEGGRSLAESIVGAFRKASRNGAHGEDEADGASPKRAASSPPSDGRPPPGPPGERKQSLGTWAKATLAAFRKAGGRDWNLQASPEEASSGKKPPRKVVGTPRFEVPSNGDPGGAQRDEGRLDADEASGSLALAFRRAFYKRRVRHEPGRDEKGDGGAPTESTLPPRPTAAFLWVAAQSRASSTAVGLEELSGARARRAGAFLLRGTDDDPYRLLRRVRRHPAPHVYLKPVFWRCADGQQSPVADHVDGVWTPDADRDALWRLRERAAAINRRIRDVIEADGETDVPPDRRVAQFVATRAEGFVVRRPEEGPGVVYPKTDPLLARADEE